MEGGSGSRTASGSVIPRRALKAGSTCPPLAARTALTTPGSTPGNASRRVVSACSRALTGRGGFAGGTSSFGGGLGAAPVGVATPPSWSLSKSRGRAVVGDSGGPSEGLRGDTGDACIVRSMSSSLCTAVAYRLIVGHGCERDFKERNRAGRSVSKRLICLKLGG